MSESAWLITHSARRFERLNTALSASLTRTGGGPLVPVSAMRSILSATAANEIGRAHPEAGLDRILRGMGAQEARPIGDGEVVNLLAWRDPIELPPRAAPAAALDAAARAAGNLDWHLTETGFGKAWQHWGGANAIDYGNVIVGHIDTGFTQHPALGWKEGTSSFVLTDRDRNFFYEELFPHPEIPSFVFANPYSAEDPLTGAFGGHGTRTASVLAGHYEAENFFGAAPRVPHVPVRISNSVWISNVMDGLADALAWLIDQVGCQVITMSMGAALPAAVTGRVAAQVDRAYERGIIYVCAAGNIVESVVAPARNPRTIAVAGTTPGGVPWSKSSHGPQVDISAPCDPIRRATVSRTGKFSIGNGDGTSFATQLVGGAAALWLARHGQAIDQAYPEPWQRVAAFLKLLTATARVPAEWDPRQYGAGILQADALLAAALPAADTLIRDTATH
jgi:hypothetical protein